MSRHQFAHVLAAAVVAAVVVCAAAPLHAGREPRSLPRARGLRVPQVVEVVEVAWRWLTGRWMEEGVVIDPNGSKLTEPPPPPRTQP